MANAQLTTLVRHIHKLAGCASAAEWTDQQLLEGFVSRQEETAFGVLVQRHGPMVLGVCRRLLRRGHDAEDAFQATLLVLVRKARSIRKRASLGSWLHGVAYRICLEARVNAARRRRHERQVRDMPQADHTAEVMWRDLRSVLDGELDRLPEKYRTPLVLCHLEGKTTAEAARQLGWPIGTVGGRLARGRQLLRTRLARRGVALSAPALATLLAREAVAAAVPTALADTTVRAAALLLGSTGVAAGVISAQTAALTEGVLKTMLLTKLKIGLAVFLAVALIGTAMSTFIQQALAQRQAELRTRTAALPPAGVKEGARSSRQRADKQTNVPAEQGKPEDKKEMTIRGRVLDPDGKPVAGAQVAVVGRRKRPYQGGELSSDPTEVLGLAKAGAKGLFRLKVSRTSSMRFRGVAVLARAGGHGLGWHDLNPDADQSQAVIRLAREQVVRGRLVDLQGQPAAGITLKVSSIDQRTDGEFKGIQLSGLAQDLPPWPAPATTDGQGRFVIQGIGRDMGVSLSFDDDRFARKDVSFRTDDKAGPKEVNKSLEPARIIEGRVRYADTGKPAPNARLNVNAAIDALGPWFGRDGRTDAQGRFRISPAPGNHFQVSAYAPAGQPYLTVRKQVEWPKAAVKQAIELKLPRGVLVRGKITEAGSGQPVAGASVQFVPRDANNPFFRQGFLLSGWENIVMSGAGGVFDIAVLPGPGHLLVHGPTPDYILQQIGGNELHNGRPGGTRHYAHALVALDLKPGSKTHEVTVKLRRGVTVSGRLVGPDGKPVAEALMVSRLNISALSPAWRGRPVWRGVPVTVWEGRFELHGCDPDKAVPVYFLDAKNKLGATVELSGKEAGKPVTVRLAPCGSAALRVVGPDGKPVARHHPWLEIVVTPGPSQYARKASEKSKLAADADTVANVDRRNHWPGRVTDVQGRVTFPALIPGATYRIVDLGDMHHVVKEEFTAEAGKTLKLPDMTLKESPE